MKATTINTRFDRTTTDDAELQQRLKQELVAAGYLALRAVTVNVYEGLVTLRGSVSCYYEKQVAQAVALRMDAVASLRNEIVVNT